MISISEAQIMAWLSPIIWPFIRVLAMFSVAPILSLRAVPMRVKVGLAFLVALSAQGVLQDQPIISVNGPQALGAVLQQLGVGLSIGFAVRLVFASVELAGELIGLQMGLNFASFFDPMTNAQTSAVSSFMGHMATLLFVAANGHLMLLMAVVKSFDAFPVDGNMLESLSRIQVYQLGANLFASALWIALPVIGLLLFVNLMLGVISRVAPQMNIFAVGFPVTLTIGLLGIALTMPMLDKPVLSLLERAFDLFGVR
ncbi:flagellar biosynthetic protein FliR [Curvibacter sp. RS43]|uniref:Flagellar biosynthetic protein FliR n=1 Tax=Curvibacter microcysteis TaxID=3026419 RepID=A0ABT5MJ45_9BURK|nr:MULTISPECIES: flagellar biosynthetic protein FliR [unclassified Curvibacter]MDD0811840.1 flagellar biosynthetic protein FliR [Curvibacter sp. RS43]MDD0816605.1 flagellar biosynthetic protein FliR [Curvibacter sp. HBC28]